MAQFIEHAILTIPLFDLVPLIKQNLATLSLLLKALATHNCR